MDLDLTDVIGLIEDAGIKVVLMETVQERIKGHEMTAHARRIYERPFLISEIEWLKTRRKVKTIGVFSVLPVGERLVEGAILMVEADGIQLKWAWKAEV